MANLFWKNKTTTKGLLSTPFESEEKFEKVIFETPEILEDIFLIKRQIRGGNKSGIPDIVGIDNDGNVCIVEIKNTTVDSSIIPQVLQYAFWAEQNPDSIKSLWLECDDKPDNLPINWEHFEVRIIVIAPNILRSALDIVNKINYSVDLIEVKRWVEGENQLILVNKLEETKTRPVPVNGLQIYDAAFYEREFNKNSAKEFIRYTTEVENLIKDRGWQSEKKFNKYYCGYKAGFFNVFGIQWIGTRTFAFFVKINQKLAEAFPIKPTRYDVQWKQAMYYINPQKTKTKDFLPIFEEAYKNFAGGTYNRQGT